MTSSWTPTNGLEAQVAEAFRSEGIVAASYHEAINQLLVAYLGYKGAYEEDVAKRSGVFGRISSLEAERDGYRQAYQTTLSQLERARQRQPRPQR